MNPSSNPLQARSRLAGESFLRRFAMAKGAFAATEFAAITPIMLTLFFGVVELSDAFTADSRVTSVASTAADLTAQEKQLCDSELTDIYAALGAIIFPYPEDKLQVVISSVVDDGAGTTKVEWSDAHNASPRGENSLISVPAGLVSTGGSVILAEITYDYSSPVGQLIYGSLSLTDKFYLHPRRGLKVARSATGC